MKKLLITGASGFLGWHLGQLARSQWQVYGSYHKHSPEIPAGTLLPLDLTDFAAVKQAIQAIQPDAILHTAALSSPNACQTNPEASYQINVLASCNLAGLAGDAGIPCVFTSSEQVFDGLNPPYRETDAVNPISRYGEHKVAAELGMQERCADLVICRMPLMFGAAPIADSFIQPWIRSLRAGKSIDLFTDEIRNPVSATDAAAGILLALQKTRGMLHLGGRTSLSRYELGQAIAEVLQLPTDQLKPCRQANVQMAAPRPPNVSLDSSKAFSLGYNPQPVRAALELLRSQL